MHRPKDKPRNTRSRIALALSLCSLQPPLYAGPVGDIFNASGVLEPIGNATGLDLNSLLVTPADNLLPLNGDANLLINPDQNVFRSINNPLSGNPAVGNNGNDKLVGNAQKGKHPHKSPVESISAPLGKSISPLVDFIDLRLDPITNPVDSLLLEPLIDLIDPITDPLLQAVHPLTAPVTADAKKAKPHLCPLLRVPLANSPTR